MNGFYINHIKCDGIKLENALVPNTGYPECYWPLQRYMNICYKGPLQVNLNVIKDPCTHYPECL